MATIEELDFELIINDNDFQKRIGLYTKAAKKFNTEVSKLLDLTKKANGKVLASGGDVAAIKKTTQAINDNILAIHAENVATKKSRDAIEAKRRAAQKAANEAKKELNDDITLKNAEYQALKRNKEELLLHTKTFQQLKALALTYFSVDMVRNFVSELVRVSAEFEKQKVALGAIIRDTIQAEGLFDKLQGLAVKSPFNFLELSSYLKQLSAFSIPTDQLFETTKMLADVSAGLGIDMGRIVLAYGQVASAEFLRGQEIRQFTEAGLPILKELANQFSVIYNRAVSIGEVFDLVSKRKVPFEMVKQVFVDLTSEGGKFYNMQSILADTLSGKISNLKDAYQLMLYEIGEATNGILVGAVDGLRNIINHWEDLARVLKVVAATFTMYKALQIVQSIYKANQALLALKATTDAVKQAQLGLMAVSKSSSWGWLAAGIALVGTAIWEYVDKAKEFTESQKILNKAASTYSAELTKTQANAQILIDKMSKLQKGTDEYDKVKKSLLVNYAEYLDDQSREAINVGNLAGAYDILSVAIEKNVKARVSAMAQEKAFAQYESDMQDIKDKAVETARDNGFDEGEIQKYLYWIESGAALDKLDRDLYRRLTAESKTMLQSGNPMGDFIVKKLTEWSAGYTAGEASYDANKARQDLDNTLTRIKENYGEAVKDIADDTNKLLNGTDESSNTQDTFVRRIEQRIEMLRKFKAMIAEFSALGVQDPQGALVGFFPNQEAIIRTQDFDAEITKLIASLKAYGDAGKEAAEKIELSLSDEKAKQYTENLKQIEEALKKAADETKRAGEKFKEGIKDFMPTTDLEGTGNEFDISKAVQKFKDGYKKIQDKYNELAHQAAMSGDDDYNTLLMSDARQKRELNNLQEFFNKMKELGEKGFDDILASFNIPDNEISKLNPIQTFFTNKKIKSLLANEFAEFDPNATFLQPIKQKLEAEGMQGGELNDALKQYFFGTKGKLEALSGQFDTTKMQSAQKLVGWMARGLGELTNNMQKYAEASGDQRMKEGAEILSAIGEVGKGFAQGGMVGGILAAAKVVIQTVAQELAYAKQLENQIAKARQQAQLYAWDEAMDVNSIFGDNGVAKMKEAEKVLGEITARYQELFATLSNQNLKTDWLQGAESMLTGLNFTGINVFGGWKDARAQIDAYYNAIAKGYRGIEAYVVKFNDRGGLANFLGFADEYTNLKDIVEGLGYELYDRYGNLNAVALNAIINTYDRLSAENKKWMKEAIGYSEEYEKAMEQINSVMQDIYGNFVSTITDTMIDKWIKLGSVTFNYADALGEVAKNLAKTIIQSAMLENVFNEEFEDKMREATLNTDVDEVMKLFNEAMKQVEGLEPFFAELLERLDGYLQDSDAADSITNGIKSITEETASLLASYINAIRADVSVTRHTTQTISTDVKAILGLFPASPTIAEHLAQIQANTYNTQMATEGILGELRSVMGSEMGYTAIRVSM